METLTRSLDHLCDTLPFHTGWHLKDLNTGAAAHRNGDMVVPSASTRKIAILMAALNPSCSKADFGPDLMDFKTDFFLSSSLLVS